MKTFHVVVTDRDPTDEDAITLDMHSTNDGILNAESTARHLARFMHGFASVYDVETGESLREFDYTEDS